MVPDLLGRTNQAFPSVWLALSAPPFPDGHGPLVEAARVSGSPIDITSLPGLWGGHLRGTSAVVSCVSDARYADATEESHATDLVQAHLIETLSCLGREYLDFYFLRVRRAAEEFQISGALQALELARQEGHIRFLGIACDGPSLATLGLWQFHDAFDVLLVPRNRDDSEAYETLAPLARERRVGVVTSRPLGERRLGDDPESGSATIAGFTQDHPVLVEVRTADEVSLALAAGTVRR